MCKYQNDAAACYDRIIPQHAMICSRKFNVPKKVCKLAATTLNKTKYHVQTAVRTSPNYYSSTKEMPLYGSGQGSGNAGTEWLFIEESMISTIVRLCEGCTMSSPDKSIKWKKIITAFVDDLRKYSNDWENNNQHVILNKLKVAAQAWEHLLYMSGGKLELDKCALYTIQWTFSEDGIAILKKQIKRKTHYQIKPDRKGT